MAGHGGMQMPHGGGGGGGGGGARETREVNTITLCRIGQETVQEIVTKTTDIFNSLKNIQLPNGTMPQQNTINQEKQQKLQESYNNIIVMFKKLKLLYEKCNETCKGPMEQNLTEDLIPWKDSPDKLKDMVQTSSQERLIAVSNERRELIERVRAKNQQLRQIMDQLRVLIWDVNSMMTEDSQKGQETSTIPLQTLPLPQPAGQPSGSRPFP